MSFDYVAERLAVMTRNPRRTLRVIAFTSASVAILWSLHLIYSRGSTVGEVMRAYFGL